MTVILSWKYRGIVAGDASVEVYRYSERPVAGAVSGEPIATVTGGGETYTDATALYGATYYYVLKLTSNGRTVVGLPRKIEVLEDLGPGPRKLLWGDRKFGYFGTVESIDVIAPLPQIGNITYQKYIRNGKIIYVFPRSSSALSLKNAGVLSGGVVPFGLTAGLTSFSGEPDVVFSSLGRNYRMRVAKFFSTDNVAGDVVDNYSVFTTEIGKSEFIDLYRARNQPVYTYWLGSYAGGSVFTPSTIFIISDSNSTDGTTVKVINGYYSNTGKFTTSGMSLGTTTSYDSFGVIEYVGLSHAVGSV